MTTVAHSADNPRGTDPGRMAAFQLGIDAGASERAAKAGA